MRRSLLVAPLVAATVLVAGCSNGGSGSSASGSTSTAATPATSATSGAGSPALTGSASNDPFCQQAASELQGVVGGGSSAVSELLPKLLDPSRAAESEAQVNQLQQDLSQAVASAPPEIKADVQTLADAINPLFDALRKSGFDLNRLDLSALTATSGDADVQAALQRVTAFVKDRCGLDITASG